jgi:hypothetical protein
VGPPQPSPLLSARTTAYQSKRLYRKPDEGSGQVKGKEIASVAYTIDNQNFAFILKRFTGNARFRAYIPNNSKIGFFITN